MEQPGTGNGSNNGKSPERPDSCSQRCPSEQELSVNNRDPGFLCNTSRGSLAPWHQNKGYEGQTGDSQQISYLDRVLNMLEIKVYFSKKHECDPKINWLKFSSICSILHAPLSKAPVSCFHGYIHVSLEVGFRSLLRMISPPPVNLQPDHSLNLVIRTWWKAIPSNVSLIRHSTEQKY